MNSFYHKLVAFHKALQKKVIRHRVNASWYKRWRVVAALYDANLVNDSSKSAFEGKYHRNVARNLFGKEFQLLSLSRARKLQHKIVGSISLIQSFEDVTPETKGNFVSVMQFGKLYKRRYTSMGDVWYLEVMRILDGSGYYRAGNHGAPEFELYWYKDEPYMGWGSGHDLVRVTDALE